MENVLTRKLERFAPLSIEDKKLLDQVVAHHRLVDARTTLISEGQASDTVRLIVDGLACRYKTLEDGSRQIVAYLVPGDFCDLNVFLLRAMDHSIATMSACTVVDIPRHRIVEMTSRIELTRALWWVTLVDEGTLREWLLNVGQRPALKRLAHLFCELYVRMQAVGLVTDDSYVLPLTQSDIADTIGLSPVHINRCLQQLREMGFVTFKDRKMSLTGVAEMMQFCGFDPSYLHFDGLYGAD